MQSTCSFPGCEKPHYAKGLCNGHYKQRRAGQELRPIGFKVPLEQRFWAKVHKTPGCWEWTAATNSNGYGHIYVEGRVKAAHRISWEWANGPVPDGMVIDHRCSNPLCVNPEHLRAVTQGQNLQHRAGPQSNSTSGIRGVRWDKRRNAWRAEARIAGRPYWGGYHGTQEAADQAARALRAQLHTHDDHDQWAQRQEKKS